MAEYEKYSFEELNEMLMKCQGDIPEELFTWTLSRGIKSIELYLIRLSKKHNIPLADNDIQEIINEVLSNVMNYFNLKKGVNLRSYMYSTAKGKFLNFFRDKICDVRVYSYDDKNKFEESFIENFFEESSFYMDIEQKIIVIEAFKKLKKTCRESLYYRKVMEYSVEEIKRIMKLDGMSEESIRKSISNCLKALKELLL